MGCGQSYWADQEKAERHEKRVARLKSIGYDKLASTIDEAIEALDDLDKNDLGALSRRGWARVDRLKSLLGSIR